MVEGIMCEHVQDMVRQEARETGGGLMLAYNNPLPVLQSECRSQEKALNSPEGSASITELPFAKLPSYLLMH
jgi:hypothetical protein